MDSLTIMLAIVIAVLSGICLFLRQAIKEHKEKLQAEQQEARKQQL